MTNDEFKVKVFNLISAAQHWQICFNNDIDDDKDELMYQKMTNKYEADIIAEHDFLTSKIDFLSRAYNYSRWHFPHRDELPTLGSQVIWITSDCSYTGTYDLMAGFVSDKFNFYPEQVDKWKYIERI